MVLRPAFAELAATDLQTWLVQEEVELPTLSVYTGKMRKTLAYNLQLRLDDVVGSERRALAAHGLRQDVPAPPALAIQAGATFDRRVDSSGSSLCEISPLVSYDGEGLLRNYPAVLNLPLLMPSRYERDPHIFAAPLAIVTELAPSAPTEVGAWALQAEAHEAMSQFPLLPRPPEKKHEQPPMREGS
eukprot:CAMPEP_0177551624 /NCGR_PEP_ID=MMETSP0369-20130122/66299_1 /TAXON_ID=447022 ORGANISM="Scrippsiella hangoei-like, Strain SHHI-4" /NCGR_SAMPLE_ID=MMETSP0369 /ASSEMBLY_ACC=CAM_ASM_000364 /LENGTH=186 /DNA_ID=CAMNT_0019037093 /DNA_START=3 /DNA_END=560 /DNA_ORIENTATION=+